MAICRGVAMPKTKPPRVAGGRGRGAEQGPGMDRKAARNKPNEKQVTHLS